jgi:hypothetical protein
MTIPTAQNNGPIHWLDELIREAKEVARSSVAALRAPTYFPGPQALIAAPELRAPLVVALPCKDGRDAALTFCRLLPTVVIGAKAAACAVVMYGKVYGSDQEAVLLLAASSAGVARYERAVLTRKLDGAVELGEWSGLELSDAPEPCGQALVASLGLYAPERVVGSCQALNVAVRGRSFINAAASKAALEAAMSTVSSRAHDAGAEPGADFIADPAAPTNGYLVGRVCDVELADTILAEFGGEALSLDAQQMSSLLSHRALMQPLCIVGFTPEQALAGDLLEEHHQTVLASAQEAYESLVASASDVGGNVGGNEPRLYESRR